MFGRTVAVELNAPDFERLAGRAGCANCAPAASAIWPGCSRTAVADRSGPVLVELRPRCKAPGQSVGWGQRTEASRICNPAVGDARFESL